MYILFAILIFGFLIFIHELGHFLTAKALDVQVNEFSICMGPAILKKQKGETLYSLRCIPVGGYCAMEGEDEESDNPRAFTSKAWWKRLIILAAGSFMNFLTGLVVLALIYSCVAGFSTAKISGFFDGCPLESSQGLQVGDELYKIDGRRVYIYSDVGTLLARNKTGTFDLVVKRDGKLIKLDDFEMKQQLYEVDGEQQYKYGLYFGYEEKTVGTVLKNMWYTALDFARLVWMSLGDLVSGLVSVNDMSGPVGIVSAIAQTGQSAATTADGILNVLYLGAFIAINLAVMNMLPLPALDGGRAFLLLVNTVFTAITKKKIPSKFEGYIHEAGSIKMERKLTRKIMVGGVPVGGGAPVSIQSMLNTRTTDVDGCLAQIRALAAAGCEIARLAVPDMEAAEAFGAICAASPLPLVADIHFDYRLAIRAAENGAAKIRINPGNIGEEERVRAVVEACGARSIPIRIGVNGGSLEPRLLEKYGHPTPEALVESAFGHIALLEKYDFHDICVSMKSSSVPLMIEAYRLFSERSDYPLHVGVTETGTERMGTIKSAMGIGALLCQGIGDTMRVSLTADPVQEVLTAKDILKAAGLRKDGVNIIACPTCGRTRIDLIRLANEVEKALADCEKPITVAVMGCVVNGPGEAREADVGIAGGDGCGIPGRSAGGRRRHRRRRRLRHSVRQGKTAQKAPLRRASARPACVHRNAVKNQSGIP